MSAIRIPALKNNSLPYLALLAGILALSMSAIFVRWADAPGPVTGLYRVFFATIALTPFFLLRCRKQCTVTRKTIIYPFLGGVFTALDFSFWNTSIFYTSASNATLLGNTAPLWVALGAWLIFHEKLPRHFWTGLLLALGGATLIMGSDFLTHPRIGFGDLLAIVSGIFYGGYYLATQRGREHFDPLSYVWLMGTFASISLAFINLGLGNDLFDYSQKTWLAFIGTALISQLIGYIAVSYAMGHLPAAIVAPTMIAQPVVTTIIAIPLLGEVPLPIQMLGGVIGLTGIYLVNRAYQKGKAANA